MPAPLVFALVALTALALLAGIALSFLYAAPTCRCNRADCGGGCVPR